MAILVSAVAFLLWIVVFRGPHRAVCDAGVAKASAGRSFASHRSGPLWVVPEYRRRMEQVVVSIADGTTPPIHQHEILSRLPDYTDILMLVPEGRIDEIGNWLEDKPYGRRVRLVGYDPNHRRGRRLYLLLPDEDQLVAVDTGDYRLGDQYGTSWAQDLFEVATGGDGRTVLLTACVYKCFSAAEGREDGKVISDNIYLDCLNFADIKVRRLPLAFKGGNVLVDEHRGGRIVFYGSDVVRTTRTAWRAFHEQDLSDAEVAGLFREALGADRVVLVGGNRPQPIHMYHLDQAMLLLHDGVVAVARIVGERPRLEPDASRIRHVERFLAELRTTLTDLGYTLAHLETSVENVLRYRHVVNAVAYVDKRTGQRTLLMSVFPDARTQSDRRLAEANGKTLRSLGYTVVEVPTTACEFYGGIHCLVNVLH